MSPAQAGRRQVFLPSVAAVADAWCGNAHGLHRSGDRTILTQHLGGVWTELLDSFCPFILSEQCRRVLVSPKKFSETELAFTQDPSKSAQR